MAKAKQYVKVLVTPSEKCPANLSGYIVAGDYPSADLGGARCLLLERPKQAAKPEPPPVG
jgi:hypothetical protein